MNEIIDISKLNYNELEIINILNSSANTVDIEIENDHYYTLQNGVISHNSLSTLSQTSSGIEPIFQIYYTRRRKINPNDKNARSDFVDELGDHWEEYQVIHEPFKHWMKVQGINITDKMTHEELDRYIAMSPYYQALANDIDGKEKVRMQGAVNQYVDHSISSTINLPEKVTVDEVSDLFMTAWESGCKGVTIYREGSRSGVLISSEKKVNVFKENHAPKRPRSLPCDIMRFVNKGEKWIGFLGLYDNKPYEVFTGLAEQVTIPHYLQSAHIVKDKNGVGNVYNLIYQDKDGYTQEFKGLSRAFNREYWNIGRLVSAILRHGMPIPNVIMLIDKLEIDSSQEITSWKNGVKRLLKKYIHDGTVVHAQSCPECQQDKLVYKDGCMMCSSCGWSKCD